jgi:ABC-type multidrug transport system fused ATPase/permease subunit
MDEATAAVDFETDAFIQKKIREEFANSTVLTIAHRIHTIMDYDKVVVMDQGKVAEVGNPLTLQKDPQSLFYSLAEQSKTLKE